MSAAEVQISSKDLPNPDVVLQQEFTAESQDPSNSAYARAPYELIPYDVSYGVAHTGSLRVFTNFSRASNPL